MKTQIYLKKIKLRNNNKYYKFKMKKMMMIFNEDFLQINNIFLKLKKNLN